MKKRNILLGALIFGASVFAVGKSSAFPLFLTSASGTISYTPSYSLLSNTNVAKISTVSVSMKNLMTVVSNQVFLSSGTNQLRAPKDAMIAFDPYTDISYLTNKSGFYHNLSGIVRVDLQDIATAFKGNNNGGSENDKILVYLDVWGHAPDGSYFEFWVSGQGSLQYSVEKHNKDSMSISLSNGADYGEYKSSDDGVSTGGFTFKGTGTAEWSGAFSTWWY
jgi:hypothetical protein